MGWNVWIERKKVGIVVVLLMVVFAIVVLPLNAYALRGKEQRIFDFHTVTTPVLRMIPIFVSMIVCGIIADYLGKRRGYLPFVQVEKYTNKKE